MRTLIAALMVTAGLAVAFLPGAAAERMETYDLVGEDPADDATHYWVTGVGDPSGLFTTQRLDIVAVEMGFDGGAVHVKLNIGTTPTGTSGYMYRVVFDAGGSTYFTCWNTQWVGGQAEEENVLGCSRFGGSQVGPDTKEGGVDVDTVDDVSFVRWEVPVGSIGDVADGSAIENVFAETWVRGVSTCCAGSTTSSQYLWNQADRAPDQGAFPAYVIGGSGDEPAGPSLDVTAGPAEKAAAPGSWLVFHASALLVGNGTANVTFAASGPSGWDASVVSEADVVLDANVSEAAAEFHVGVPDDAADGGYTVSLTAIVDGVEAGVANVTVTVDASLEPVDERAPATTDAPPTDDGPTGNETTGNGTAQNEDGGGSAIPGPGALLALGIVAAAALLARRRR